MRSSPLPSIHGRGTMLGPLLAFMLLQAGVEMRQVFLASVVPGTLVIALLILALPAPVTSDGAEVPRLRWRALDARVRGLILAAGGLALATAAEAFLVLWASYRGLEVAWVPLLWAAAHAMRALVSTPASVLSDRIARTPVVIIGWFARIGLLLAFAVIPDCPLLVWTLLLLYAAATKFTEGAERALIGDFAPPRTARDSLWYLSSGLRSARTAGGGSVWIFVAMDRVGSRLFHCGGCYSDIRCGVSDDNPQMIGTRKSALSRSVTDRSRSIPTTASTPKRLQDWCSASRRISVKALYVG